MKKKILGVILILIIFAGQTLAFGNKNKGPVICQREKLEYVNVSWWENFNDANLNDYIIKAVKTNHDAIKASWKVEEYRQFVKLQFGQELPSLSIGGDYAGVHFPGLPLLGKDNIFLVPLQANYQADIFLKNKDKTKSKKKQYEASRFEEKAVYIQLASNVATVYVNIMKDDEAIDIQKQMIAVKKEELAREKAKFSRGLSTMQTLNDLKNSLRNDDSTLCDLIKARDKSLTQLAVLIGESPDCANCLKRSKLENFEYGAKIPDCIPSDVIFSRPDIMEKESELEKAKIDITVARKEFLPTINVTGLYAFSNLGAGNFFNWNSTLASILVSATQDLFKGGMKFANLRIEKSRYEQMFQDYKQTDLKALKEVNDSLLIIKEDTQINKNANILLSTQKDTYQRSENKYKRGVISYPKLLNEKELLLAAQKTKINAKAARLIDYITLYNAVGGKL